VDSPAKKLLQFHSGLDDRIEIERKATANLPIKNPAGNVTYDARI